MTGQIPLPDGTLGVVCAAMVPVMYRGHRHLDGGHITTWADLYETDQRAVRVFAEVAVDALTASGHLPGGAS